MRLIDVSEYSLKGAEIHWIEHDYHTINIHRKPLYEIPTVDAVPVKHGRWVMDEEPHDGDVRCSVCLIAIDQMHERNHGLLNVLTGGKWNTFYHYCPNCGAKMDLEETNAEKET